MIEAIARPGLLGQSGVGEQESVHPQRARARLRGVGLVIATFAPLVLAQEAPEAARPEIKVGDVWEYVHLNFENVPVSKYRVNVTFVSEKAIITHVVRANGQEVEAAWTPDWNAVNSILSQASIKPHTGFFRFPLRAGSTHDAKFLITFPNLAQSAHEYTVRVVGWENVTVPAGTFNALKVIADGGFRRVDVYRTSPAKSTFWYVPGVKRWVRFQFDADGNHNKYSEELVGFSLKE